MTHAYPFLCAGHSGRPDPALAGPTHQILQNANKLSVVQHQLSAQTKEDVLQNTDIPVL